MKYLLLLAILLTTTQAQEDVKAKHAAYNLCVQNVEKDPHKAFGYCSDYLNKYPNDEKRLTEFAGKFVTAYQKISQYLKSVPMNYFTEKTTGWAVYSPGLLVTIPSEDSKHPKYPILIKREYGSPDEEKLLVKAESLYKNPEPVERELFKEWRFTAEPYVVLRDGEPKWWGGTSSGILATELVTNGAVLYYYNMSQTLRNNGGRVNENASFEGSDLKYEASIKKMDVYERAGKSFNMFTSRT